MTLLDAYGLVALVGEEPAAQEVEDLLRSERVAMNAVNFAESMDVLLRIHGLPAQAVRDAIAPLVDTTLEIRPVAAAEAWSAAELRARYYDRRLRALSLADCLLVAAARGEGIATADPAVADVARAEGIELVALRDSSGRRPE